MRTTLIAAAFVICAGLSLTPKVMSAISEAHHAPAAPVMPAALSAYLDQGKFHFVGSRALANDGIHIADFYKSHTCGGQLTTVRLSRNAEGVHLLSALRHDPAMATVYLLDGQWYEDYPELTAVVHRFWSALRMRFGMVHDLTDVWAVTASGRCLPEK